jgi:translation initiation factor 6 (eIF-6)
VVKCVDERLSALGNCIACNDHVALTHPDLDKASPPTPRYTLDSKMSHVQYQISKAAGPIQNAYRPAPM